MFIVVQYLDFSFNSNRRYAFGKSSFVNFCPPWSVTFDQELERDNGLSAKLFAVISYFPHNHTLPSGLFTTTSGQAYFELLTVSMMSCFKRLSRFWLTFSFKAKGTVFALYNQGSSLFAIKVIWCEVSLPLLPGTLLPGLEVFSLIYLLFQFRAYSLDYWS